jgi:hypothetical protein
MITRVERQREHVEARTEIHRTVVVAQARRRGPTGGHANAPTRTLADVKADPNPATSTAFDKGITDLVGQVKSNKDPVKLMGRVDDIVTGSVGKNIIRNYDKVKPVTDRILTTCLSRSDLTPQQKNAIVEAVNLALMGTVMGGLTNPALKHEEAERMAAEYITEPRTNPKAPNTMDMPSRLHQFMHWGQTMQLLDQGTVHGVILQTVGDLEKASIGIGNVNYDQLKPVTDDFLGTYLARSDLTRQERKEVVSAVNDFLLGPVIGSLVNPGQDRVKAENIAVKYVTGPLTGFNDPNPMDARSRLKKLMYFLKLVEADQKVINEVKIKCQNAIANPPKKM